MTSALRVAIHGWPVEGRAPRLADHDVLIHSASLLADDAELGRMLEPLPADEQERHASYTNQVVARRFLVARCRLREILGAIIGLAPADVPLRYGLHGKPVLARSVGARHVWFSVAHCEELLLVAVSRHADVGIDVERSRSIEQWERLADRVLDPYELAQLKNAVGTGADAGTTFLRHWCRVEAELKAIGCGIAGLEAHRAGKRPLGFRWVDLHSLALPADVEATGARYQAAVAICAPGVESARHAAFAASQDAMPTINPASASTP